MVAGSRTSLAGTVASRSVAGVDAGEGGEATGAELRGVHPARVADGDVEALRHDAGDHDGIGADLVALVTPLDAEVAGGVRQRRADVRRPGRQVPAQRPVVLHPRGQVGRALRCARSGHGGRAGRGAGCRPWSTWARGSGRARGRAAQSSSGSSGSSEPSGPLADAEDHELGRPHRRDADEYDEPAVVDVVLRHRGPVAPDEERVLRLRPDQAAVAPERGQELLDLLADARPEPLVVRLEHDPLGGLVDGCLDEGSEAADVDVLPLRVVGAHGDRKTRQLLDVRRRLEPL